MRVVFMGTPEFAVPCLQAVAQEHELLAVFTQPDRKQGRGQKVHYSEVKRTALELNVPIYQPERVGKPEFISIIEDLQPEIIVVVAFGQKIPRKILELAKHGCINVHSSLLPKYRGAAPINYAIINGETVTGVSTMYLSSEWDAGDVILQDKELITKTDTAGTLHDRLSVRGASLLVETLKQIEGGTAPRIVQDHSQASFAPKMTKEIGAIDWQRSASEVNNLIRGTNPWPGAYTYYADTLIKVWQSEVDNTPTKAKPGEVVAIEADSLVVATGAGMLSLQQVQRQGSRVMSGRDVANGMRIQVGEILGETNATK